MMTMSQLKAHLRYTATIFLGRLAPARGATVYSDDVFLVSYPKSGNTWMRFLVGNLVFPNDPITFSTVETRMPSIYGMNDKKLRGLSRPRYIKSHEPFHSKYQNIIYIVRDPRDVAVSYFHFAAKTKNLLPNDTLESFVARLINDEIWLPYGTWADHVLSWLAMRPSRQKFLFLRYEDLLSETKREMSKVAAFLQVDATPERLGNVVEMSSAKRMRDLEKSEWKSWNRGIRQSRRDIPFVRAAEAGQSAKALSPGLIASIENAWGPLMEVLGYTLVTPAELLHKQSAKWISCEAQVRAVWRGQTADLSLPSNRELLDNARA